MSSTFTDLIDTGKILVADGATGTVLFDLGLETGGCPELLNLERTDLITKVHRGYVEAGSDIILTNTFGGTRARLKLHGLQDRVAELNGAAASLARAVADQADRAVAVAGSIGPTGELFDPLGPLTRDEGIEIFSEQAEALVDAGVDVLWIETISSWEELDAAVAACSGRGVPVTATLSFDTNGHTMMGIRPDDFGKWWNTYVDQPTAIGANCGVGPGDNVQAASLISEAAPQAIVIAKGNCGIPLYKDDALVYPTLPDGMVPYTELAIRSGARVVGACCGSGFDHIAQIRATVDAGVEGSRPDHAEMAARLGDLSTIATATRERKRRRG